MKVTVTYDMSKDEDRRSYALSQDALNMYLALHDLATMFRSADKYNTFAGSQLTNDMEQCLMHEVNRQFWVIMNEREIDPFEEPST
jgi:hypothetical protein